MLLADAEALEAELLAPGSVTVTGDLVGTGIVCYATNVRRHVERSMLFAAVSFDLVERIPAGADLTQRLRDGLVWGDAVTVEGGVVPDSVTDGLVLGDTVTRGGTRVAAITDGLVLGDTPAGTYDATRTGTATDGLVLGDTPAAYSGEEREPVTDGIVFSEDFDLTIETAFDDEGLILGDTAAYESGDWNKLTITEGVVFGEDMTTRLSQPFDGDGITLGDTAAAAGGAGPKVTTRCPGGRKVSRWWLDGDLNPEPID
jgi:hypothetical protein